MINLVIQEILQFPQRRPRWKSIRITEAWTDNKGQQAGQNLQDIKKAWLVKD